MASPAAAVVCQIQESRKHFLRHLNGVRDDQLDWKPSPLCKSIREIVAHLVEDDRNMLAFVGGPSEEEGPSLDALDMVRLRALLDASHERFCEEIATRFADSPPETPVSPEEDLTLAALGDIIAGEDNYHAGQVAYIRLATDPKWDYDSTIYAD